MPVDSSSEDLFPVSSRQQLVQIVSQMFCATVQSRSGRTVLTEHLLDMLHEKQILTTPKEMP